MSPNYESLNPNQNRIFAASLPLVFSKFAENKVYQNSKPESAVNAAISSQNATWQFIICLQRHITVYRDIFDSVNLFSPSLPAGKFKTGRMPMSYFIFLLTQFNCVWANSRRGETDCKSQCKRTKITRGEINPIYSMYDAAHQMIRDVICLDKIYHIPVYVCQKFTTNFPQISFSYQYVQRARSVPDVFLMDF